MASLPQPPVESNVEPTDSLTPDLETYLAVLEALQRPRRHLASAPTFKPKNFIEQIQFSDNGTTRQVHFYINNNWRSVTVT